MEEKVRKEVLAKAKDGKLPCRVALDMAKELGCDPSVVGKVANEEKVKIISCSLGCF